ncbi:MAG TPA: hypothetical protein VIM70_08755 [Clostridium sp.]|uniref:hypothetical protein n=1 Tax=Clostridium sp. TaxID=1506 RepID=UPI002F93106F
MLNVYFASSNWKPTENNPFIADGSYGEKWSAFIYDDSINNLYTNVFPNTKVYSLIVKPQIDKEFERLIDFVIYETSYGRNIILKIPNNSKEVILAKLETLSKNNKNIIRATDIKWLVHSTTKQLWEKIKITGELLSPSCLKHNGKEVNEIGLKALLEPMDYSDFIMLDVVDGCGELVVNSRQRGYICLDPNIEYIPGVRIYFNAHKIISYGLATRDGLHVLKVFERLPLDKYMALAIEDKMLTRRIWTPTTYTHFSNEFFLKHVEGL